MKSIFSRLKSAPEAPKASVQPTMSMKDAKTQLAQFRTNLESSMNVIGAVSRNISEMQNNTLAFRGSRVRAYDMLSRVVSSKRGKTVAGLNLESFGITDFVSNAVKTNLESAEAMEAELKSEVASTDIESVLSCAKEVFANSAAALEKNAVDIDAKLTALREGNTECCVNGAEGDRINKYFTAEGVMPESAEGKKLVETLTALKEQGTALKFDCDGEVTSVVIASRFDIASDVGRFPLEFYLLVRKALVEDAGVDEQEYVNLILAKHHDMNALVGKAMDIYANRSFAEVSLLDKEFNAKPSVMEVVVKSYSSNPYRPLIQLSNEACDKVLDDLSKVKSVLASESTDESTKMAAVTYAGFICLLLNVIK